MSLSDVPPDVFQCLVYELRILSVKDVRSLLLTAKWVWLALVDDHYGRHQHRALAGVWFCIRKHWWGSAHLALTRNIGKPNLMCLIDAVTNNRLNLVSRLVEYDFNPHYSHIHLPLVSAVRQNSEDIVDVLLASGKMSDRTISMAMCEIALTNNIDMWKKLVTAFKSEEIACLSLFDKIVDNNRLELAQVVLDHPKTRIVEYGVGKYFADSVAMGYTDFVRLLIPFTTDAFWQKRGSEMIDTAVHLNDAETLKIILDEPRSLPERIQPEYVCMVQRNGIWRNAAKVLVNHPAVRS